MLQSNFVRLPQFYCFLDNNDTDAAITMGMVLLNEAATSKGDVGKRRSKLFLKSCFQMYL